VRLECEAVLKVLRTHKDGLVVSDRECGMGV
jgi:hypothetical protein